jgi:hypothetical protein
VYQSNLDLCTLEQSKTPTNEESGKIAQYAQAHVHAHHDIFAPPTPSLECMQCKRNDSRMCREIKTLGHEESKLEIVEPVLDHNPAFVERLLVHAHDDRCVRMAVVVDVHWVFLEAHVVQSLDHAELILCQG